MHISTDCTLHRSQHALRLKLGTAILGGLVGVSMAAGMSGCSDSASEPADSVSPVLMACDPDSSRKSAFFASRKLGVGLHHVVVLGARVFDPNPRRAAH